jgi:hypothetical protein
MAWVIPLISLAMGVAGQVSKKQQSNMAGVQTNTSGGSGGGQVQTPNVYGNEDEEQKRRDAILGSKYSGG